MELWVDSNLSHRLCPWIAEIFHVSCRHIRAEGLRESDDGSVFEHLRRPGAVLLSKDGGFSALVRARGAPPQIIRIACGNLPNPAIKQVLSVKLENALQLIQSGSVVVEITVPRR